jgi:ABC-2 type transport system permease protein
LEEIKRKEKSNMNKIKNIIQKIINPVSAKADVKRSHIIQLVVGLVVIIFINVIGSYFFGRLDLTQEKRYSLSKSTKELLRGGKKGEKKLDDVITIRCYLDGDLPANYKKLRNETKDMLDQFRSYNHNVEYEFIDPNGFKNDKDKNDFYEKLFSRGLSPILIKTQSGSKQEQQYIFPYIELSYGGRTKIVSLLSTKTGFSEDEVIKSSIQNLEYTLYSSIRSMIQGMKTNIAFLYGQGEIDAPNLLDIIQSLNEQYSVDSITINGQINALVDRRYDSVDNTKIKFMNKYSCLIVAKPTIPFSQKDLYIIDQYIMHGGKVLWLVDPLTANMDSLQSRASTMAVSNYTGLEECLFTYGVRLNNDLVMDLQCVQVPIVTGQYGNGSHK